MWRVGKTSGERTADASKAGRRLFTEEFYSQLQRSAEASYTHKQVLVNTGEEGQKPASYMTDVFFIEIERIYQALFFRPVNT